MAKTLKVSGNPIIGTQSINSVFTVNDTSGSPVMSIQADTTDVTFQGNLILKDVEQDEEWALSVNKGKLVLTPRCKKSTRRHKLNESIDGEDGEI